MGAINQHAAYGGKGAAHERRGDDPDEKSHRELEKRANRNAAGNGTEEGGIDIPNQGEQERDHQAVQPDTDLQQGIEYK